MFIYVIILISAIIFFFLWQYVFSVYEVFYDTKPEHLYASGGEVMKIECVPLNALGFRAPFRTAPFSYKWESGRDLLQIAVDNSASGYLILKSAGKEGTAVLRVKGKYALLDSIIEIRILANVTVL